MVDLFEEVEEQLRSDRYKTLAQKAAPWVVGLLGAALVAALAVWGWQSYTTKVTSEASEKYVEAVQAFGENRPDAAIKLWEEVAKSNAPGYKALALMQLGAVHQAKNEIKEAVRLYDEAGVAAKSPLVADAARLKSALALLDTAAYKDLEARLKPLTEKDRPYRAEAREALAFAKLLAGDEAGAKADFALIEGMLDASESTRQRAGAAVALIESGGAKALPAAVKAAAALPPSALAPPPQPQAPGPQ